MKAKVTSITLRRLVHGDEVQHLALVSLTPVDAPIGNHVIPVAVTGDDDPNITYHPVERWIKKGTGEILKTVVGERDLVIGVKGDVDGKEVEFHQFSVYDISIALAEHIKIEPSPNQHGE